MFVSIMDSDLSVDDLDGAAFLAANFPAGASYLDMAYFAQDVVSDEFPLFNYGPVENMKKYGQAKPPNVPLENFKVPVALINGTSDKLSTIADVAWLDQKISESVVYRGTYALGHASFGIAKDMTWFS